jgi:anaerobic magnesium-protoporphyrin IX monomethyl ester cyclase
VLVLFVQVGYQERVEHTSLISVVPPLELASCAAVVRDRVPMVQVRILDANALSLSVEETIARVGKAAPDVVVAHSATHTINATGRLASATAAPLVLLGPHGTALPRETLEEFAGIDVVVLGEPEETLAQLLCQWDAPETWADIAGIAFGRGADAVVTRGRGLMARLDQLPLPARDLLPNPVYRSPYARRVTSLRTTRGCPGRCTFCDSHLLYGCGTRLRDPASVVEEFALCNARWQTDYVAIIDHTFTADAAFVAEVCDGLIRRGLHRRLRWVCNTRVDMLADDLVALMRRAGCLQVGLGIEAGDNRRLASLRKGVSEEQLSSAIGSLKRHGIIAMGYAIIGFPDDTEESVARTRERLFHFDPHVLQLSFATPLPGTALWRQAKDEERFLSTNWDDFVFLRKSILRGDHLSNARLMELRDTILRDFYLRPAKLASLAAFLGCRAGVSPIAASRAAVKVLANLMRGS